MGGLTILFFSEASQSGAESLIPIPRKWSFFPRFLLILPRFLPFLPRLRFGAFLSFFLLFSLKTKRKRRKEAEKTETRFPRLFFAAQFLIHVFFLEKSKIRGNGNF